MGRVPEPAEIVLADGRISAPGSAVDRRQRRLWARDPRDHGRRDHGRPAHRSDEFIGEAPTARGLRALELLVDELACDDERGATSRSRARSVRDTRGRTTTRSKGPVTLRRFVQLLLLALAVCACLAPPAAATGETYGLGDAPGTFAHCRLDASPGGCRAEAIAGYFADRSFRALTAPASAHRITQVRLFVSYDAVEEYNGSPTSPGCTLSRVAEQSWRDGAGRLHAAGQSWTDLQAGLLAARADGLAPVVSITGYGSPNATPSWDQPAPDTTTLAGWWGYRCGVEGVLNAVSRLPAADWPHVWEAVNEPDSFSIYKDNANATDESCAVVPVSDIAGAAKAACAYILAAREIHQFAGHAGDTVIAGVFTHPDPAYLKPYTALLATQLAGALYPATWAVHDYDDVTASYAGPVSTHLQAFDQALAADTGGGARDLWVTETGTLLTNHVVAGRCPAAGVDAAGTLGACGNGQRARQVNDAAAFFALPAAGTAVPVTHLFWYQWAGEMNWDSGLSDATRQLRAPWCAFYGSGACTGSPSVSIVGG